MHKGWLKRFVRWDRWPTGSRKGQASTCPRFRGGNSAILTLVLRGDMVTRATQLRTGGAIPFGEVDSTGDWPTTIPYQDAFAVTAEVTEVETEPSIKVIHSLED